MTIVTRVIEYAQLRKYDALEVDGQKAVAQKVSPRGSDASVLTSVSPHSAPSMPLTMPAIDGADHGMLDRHIAERAVVVDDPQLVVALVGMRGEPVSGERVGNGLHRRAQTALAGSDIGAREAGGHCLPVLLTDLFGHRLGLLAGQQRQRLAEQRQHEIVAAHRHVDRHIGHRAVALRRAAGAGTLGTLDGNLEVAAGGEPVEMMAGDVGVQAELLGHLRRGDALVVLACEQVDAATGGIAERVGDGRNRRGEGT